MKATVSRIVEKSELLTCINYFKGQVSCRLGWSPHRSGATHSKFGIDESVAYVEAVVSDYLQYSGVQPSHIVGKHILEVGPGDNLGVALSLIAKGAASVTCLDRFGPFRDEGQNVGIYRRLIDRFSEEERERARDVVGLEGDVAHFRERITPIYGTAIEKAHEKIGTGRFDIIVSRAVLEHVSDVGAAWESMVRLLRRPGEMWHKIDFRNHKKFTQFHPLHFLTYKEATWRLLTSPDPTLNRERFPTYRRLAENAFVSNAYYITHVLEGRELIPHPRSLTFGVEYGSAELEKLGQIRPSLDRRFSELSDEDLLIGGLFLICRDLKDGAAQRPPITFRAEPPGTPAPEGPRPA